MPNHFFKFKQFTVHQQHSAMKVCTEACLFGAWLAELVKSGTISPVNTMLDIGSGTGLLSLMLAQASKATIDAVEIDPMASRESFTNFNASPFNNRLRAVNTRIQHFAETANHYDLIFSNPPFYTNNLLGPDENRNLAHHDQSLSLEQLISCTDKMLGDGAYFALLIPYQRGKYFEELLLNYPFSIIKKTNVKQTNHHSFFRSMYLLGKNLQTTAMKENEMVIKDGEEYSDAFKHLLKDYYLNL